MRKDHCIIWKDENIENNENSKYMKELSKKMEVNVYSKKTVQEALDIIRKKNRCKIKLITNGGYDLSGKTLIKKSRIITRSNFVCLVFANSIDHLEWITEMENVLFTNDPKYFKKFAEIEMKANCILKFAHELEQEYSCTFKINEKELLKFPLDQYKKDPFWS